MLGYWQLSKQLASDWGIHSHLCSFFQKRENTNATCAPMLLSAVLTWTSTWLCTLWSWWAPTPRTSSAPSRPRAAMERSTLITTGEHPDEGCAPHTVSCACWGHVTGPPFWCCGVGALIEVFVLPISGLGWAVNRGWLPRAVWLGWPLGRTQGFAVGLVFSNGFVRQLCS